MLNREQYEVWSLKAGKWDLAAWFPDFEVASAVMRKRTYRTRLIHAVYEGNQRMKEDVLAELGATREHP